MSEKIVKLASLSHLAIGRRLCAQHDDSDDVGATFDAEVAARTQA
jgi:hypothetical protein